MCIAGGKTVAKVGAREIPRVHINVIGAAIKNEYKDKDDDDSTTLATELTKLSDDNKAELENNLKLLLESKLKA